MGKRVRRMGQSWAKWIPVLAVAVAGLASPGSAQDHLDVSVFVGPSFFMRDLADPALADGLRVDDAGAFGARVFWGSNRFGFEGFAAIIPTEMMLGSEPANRLNQTVVALAVEAIVVIAGGGLVEPFVAIGGGDKHYRKPGPAYGDTGGFNAGSDAMVSVGGGARMYLSETLHLRLDVRDLISKFNMFEPRRTYWFSRTQHDLLITLGVAYRIRLN